jgi:hypothetical protein
VAADPGGVEQVALVALEDDLAAHVMDLLSIVGVPAQARSTPGSPLVSVLVPAADVARSRASIDLVLPGLLAEEAGELLPDDGPGSGLSRRLIRRSDWPGDPDPAAPQPSPGPGSTAADGPRSPGPQDAAEGRWQGAGTAAQDDDGDFVPPPPPPIPRAADAASRFAWLGAVGGPILMVLSALLGLGPLPAGAGLAAFIVGFGVLVARMPDRPRQDDGWDDGAVL